MYKAYVIALREYRAAVRSKAFVITLVVMPILMAGSIVVQLLLKDQVDTSDKRFAIVDRSGHFEVALTKAVREYNEKQVFEGAGESRKKVKPEFVLEFVDAKQIGDPPESTWMSLRINSEWVCDALLEWLEVVLAVVKNVECVEMATPRAAVDGNPTTSW